MAGGPTGAEGAEGAEGAAGEEAASATPGVPGGHDASGAGGPDAGAGQGESGSSRPRAAASWWPLAVITLVTLVDRIETYVVSGVLPLLQEEWGFSDTAGGAIPLAISIAGLLALVPAGYLADRVARTRLLAVVVALWSVITLSSGLATGFVFFFATRVVLGAADSLDTPSQSSLIGDYYETSRRPVAYGVQRMVYFAGAGVGLLVGGVVGQALGWRAAFFVMVLPGLAVAWLCWRLREPERGDADRHAAQDAAVDSAAEPAPAVARGWASLREQAAAIWRVGTLRLLLVGVPVFFLGMNGFVYWAPTYFVRTWGVGSGTASAAASGILIVGVVGGTVLGSHLGRRWHGRVPGGRVLAGGGGLLLGALLLTAALTVPPPVVQVPALTASVVLLAVAIPTLFAAAADCLHHSYRGLGFALLQFGVTLGSSIGPLAVGAVSDATGSLAFSFATLGVPMLVASLIVLAARNRYEPDAAKVLETTAAEARR